MLFVIGAMAALAIDVVSLYAAQGEAQLAADGAALAGARVLANSGVTSESSGALMPSAQILASTVATQVAQQNQIGGNQANVLAPTFGGSDGNPTITVSVQNTLPTFFARIWGKTQITVGATATAEAYNPSLAPGTSVGSTTTPVAPVCVKPWLLPNISPTAAGGQIFSPTTGAIVDTTLLGWTSSAATPVTPMSLVCPAGNCTPLPFPTQPWQYYPGDPNTTFPPPTTSLAACSVIPTLSDYQKSIVGCIQVPISCNSTANIDVSSYPNRNTETADAVNCLTNCTNNFGDTVTTTNPPNAIFQFYAGQDNPEVLANPALSGQPIMVSDSLVTVPVFDTGTFNPAGTNFQIIGFVQLFLNPNGFQSLDYGPTDGNINTTVINLAGCGANATGTPIVLGNGASPVAVRLISQ